MRNEEPTRADPPPGFTGDLAADLGASLSVSPSSRRATSTRASCSWATWATSSSVVSTAARAERATSSGRRASSTTSPTPGAARRATGSGRLPRRSGSSVRSTRRRSVPSRKASTPTVVGSWNASATDHTPGWDFTLSAPKSVSLAWALADEPLRAALAEAHRGAVKAAFSFLEDEGGRARRGFGGRDGHVSAGLAVACFVHPASRELDPQLHTHGIVCNVVEGSDGRWTALDSRMIYMHRRAAASISSRRASRACRRTRWPMARPGPARPVRARGL